MPAIVETREPLEEPVDMERVQADIDLRIRAGAIRCRVDGEPLRFHPGNMCHHIHNRCCKRQYNMFLCWIDATRFVDTRKSFR